MKVFKIIQEKSKNVWQFVNTQIWERSKTSIRDRIIMTIYIAVRRYDVDDLQTKSAALTFSTLLAIIPLLALVFAILKGLGFSNVLDPDSFDSPLLDKETVSAIFTFIDNYLAQTKDGVFIGVGIASLLLTIWGLISTLERIFNDIWRTKSLRTYTRRFTDYFSFLFILPFLLIITSGISAFASSYAHQFFYVDIITPSLSFLGKILPLITSWILFTVAYVFIPNTKVHFSAAAISGFIAGIAFNIFQALYISGQIWVTRYNAIFGGFAAIPLLMLWLQASWLICLVGAEIACTGQNIEVLKEEFRFFRGTICTTDKEFIALVITYIIIKRMKENQNPISVPELVTETYTPMRLIKQTLHELIRAKIIIVCQNNENGDDCYAPYIDINTFSTGMLFERLGTSGDGMLLHKTSEKFKPLYDYYMDLKDAEWKEKTHKLIKDL